MQSRIFLSDGKKYTPIAVFEGFEDSGKRYVRLISRVISRFRVPDEGPYQYKFPADCIFHKDKGKRVLIIAELIEDGEKND